MSYKLVLFSFAWLVACAGPPEQGAPDRADAGVDMSSVSDASPDAQQPFGCDECNVFVGEFFDGVAFQTGAVSVRGDAIDDVVSEAPDAVIGTRIDLVDQTLLPGMYDLHVHSSVSAAPYGYFPPRAFIEELLKANLRNGVVGVLDLGTQDVLIFELRARLRAAELLGPRLFAAGPMFTAPGGHPCTAGPPTACRLIDEQSDVVPAVANLLSEHRPDVIKVIIEGGIEASPLNRLDPQYLDDIVSAAGDVPVVAHVGAALDVRDALAAGITRFAHIPYTDALTPGDIDALREADASFISTLAVADGLVKLANGDLDDPDSLRDDVPMPVLDALRDPTYAAPLQTERYREFADDLLANSIQNFRALHEAGVRLVAGTDAGNPNTFHGWALAREVELYVEHGATIEQALAAATSLAAGFLGGAGGVVQAGAPADLVVVNGALKNDLGALRNVHAVWLGGRELDPAQLSVEGDFPLTDSPPRGLAEGARCLDPLECGDGLSCEDWGFVCRPECDGGFVNDCDEGVCFASTWADGGYCFLGDDCDVFAQDCENEAACLWLGNGETTCWFAANGRQGEPCSASNTCAAGYQCSFSTGLCAAICDPAAPNCPVDTTCADLSQSAGFSVGECR